MLRALVVGLVVALVASTAAAEAPVLRGRTRTRLGLVEVERVGSSIEIRGELTDTSTGAPLAGRSVQVATPTGSGAGTTLASGAFTVRMPFDAPEGEWEFVARYAGETLYAGAEATQRFTIGKARLDLRLDVPGELAVTEDALVLTVAADSRGSPEQVAVQVTTASEQEEERAVTRVETGRDGRAVVTVPRAKLGEPGDKRVIVRFAGDDVFNPSEAQARFLLVTGTEITDLETPTRALRHESDLEVSGRLVDSEGAAIAGAEVELHLDGKPTDDTVTDGGGRFRFRHPAAKLGPGPASLRLVSVSRVAWRRGVELPPRVIFVLEPRPVPLAYPIGAFAVTAIGLLAFGVARVRPWVRRRDSGGQDSTPRPVADAMPEPLAPGLKPARPGIISTLRRPHDHGLTGMVRDCVRQTGVPGAVVSIAASGGEEPIVLACSQDGEFAHEGLAAGTFSLTARAPGYVTFELPVMIPHRGELRGAFVDLVPVREEVFTRYREVAAALLPDPTLWGKWTPREILVHVRSRHPAGALARLTDLVEDAYFSVRQPDEDILPAVDTAVAAARSELPRT